MPYRFVVNVKEQQDKHPTMTLLPKLPMRQSKGGFIANLSSCTTTKLSELLNSCLTAVKSHVIWYYETVYERSRKACFGPACY